MSLGANIRRLRKAKNMSAAELARKAGLSSVKMIEAGKSLSPHFEHLQGIARVLGVTIAELYVERPKSSRASAARPEMLSWPMTTKIPRRRGRPRTGRTD